MTSPLIIIHALRLHEGPTKHRGGNFYHMRHLLPALLPLLEELGLSVVVLVDELGARDFASIIPERQLLRIGDSSDGILRSDAVVRAAVSKFKPALYYRPTGQLPWGRLNCICMVGVADLNFRWLKMSVFKRIYKELSYRWSFSQAERVICISEFTRRDVAVKFKVSDDKLRVVHHGAPRLPEPSDKHGVTECLWLTFGHQSHKNVELCLCAFVRWVKIHPEDVLVIVGDNPHLTRVLKPLAQSLGVTSNVKFVGKVSSAELSDLYWKAKALLFLSRFEGFGLPVLEAMQVGCPVIASDVCSLPEVAGDAAILINPDDEDALLRAMNQMDDPAERMNYIAKGKARAAQFTWEAAGRRTADIILELLPDLPGPIIS
jgi:glycosyltransferase involved in cell wall biosynthesis